MVKPTTTHEGVDMIDNAELKRLARIWSDRDGDLEDALKAVDSCLWRIIELDSDYAELLELVEAARKARRAARAAMDAHDAYEAQNAVNRAK
jgi:hypothetical protein